MLASCEPTAHTCQATPLQHEQLIIQAEAATADTSLTHCAAGASEATVGPQHLAAVITRFRLEGHYKRLLHAKIQATYCDEGPKLLHNVATFKPLRQCAVFRAKSRAEL